MRGRVTPTLPRTASAPRFGGSSAEERGDLRTCTTCRQVIDHDVNAQGYCVVCYEERKLFPATATAAAYAFSSLDGEANEEPKRYEDGGTLKKQRKQQERPEQQQEEEEEEEEVVIADVKNEQEIMPHLRSDCPLHPFRPGANNLVANEKFCKDCFCFVCDLNPAYCQSWAVGSETAPAAENQPTQSTLVSHCHARPPERRWRKMRKEYKRCGVGGRAPVIELDGSDDGGEDPGAPPIPKGTLDAIFFVVELSPDLEEFARKSRPVLTRHCGCQIICSHIKRMVVGLPVMILHGLNHVEARKHKRMLLDDGAFYVKQEIGTNNLIVSKKIIKGVFQEPPWVSVSPSYPGNKSHRVQCPHPSCGWFSPALTELRASRYDQCSVCLGRLKVKQKGIKKMREADTEDDKKTS